jgi:hypothetical protein
MFKVDVMALPSITSIGLGSFSGGRVRVDFQAILKHRDSRLFGTASCVKHTQKYTLEEDYGSSELGRLYALCLLPFREAASSNENWIASRVSLSSRKRLQLSMTAFSVGQLP